LEDRYINVSSPYREVKVENRQYNILVAWAELQCNCGSVRSLLIPIAD
jgi:hypothetical protein